MRSLPVLLVVLSLLACGDASSDATDEGFSVALLLPGPENDEGWNQGAYEGLLRIRDELGARTRKISAESHTEIQTAFERAAAEGFDLIIGHGVEFNLPAAEIAKAYPDVTFLTSGGTTTANNLATLVMRLEEAAYQLGVLAAHVTESGILSALSGFEYEPVRRVVDGFEAGVHSIKPDAKVLVEYLGTWSDSALAKEKAFAHADAGADVFFQNADAAGVGIFEACRERGHVAFGCNRDQTSKAADVILASAVADIPDAFVAIAQEVMDGTFAGGVRSFGMQEDKVRVAYNDGLGAKVPEAAREAVGRAGQAILDGVVRPGQP